MRPMTLNPVSAFSTKPHGTRLRYLSGCRCLPCRAANSRDICRFRRLALTGRGNPIVDAGPMKAHVRALSRAGLGYKRVARLAGVAVSTVGDVIHGRQDNVRRSTANRVLAVRVSRAVMGPSALVPIGPTRKLVDRMVRDGYTKARLAALLGYRVPALQFLRSASVTVATERKVRKLAAWLLVDSQGRNTQEIE